MAPTVRLRRGVTESLQKMFGCETVGAVADVLEIDPSQLSRISNWRSSPGPNFTARLLIATKGRATYEELFEVVEDDDSDDRSAAPPMRRVS